MDIGKSPIIKLAYLIAYSVSQFFRENIGRGENFWNGIYLTNFVTREEIMSLFSF